MKQDIYKTILDSLFDGVYLVDRQRCITYWNLGAQRISGYSQEEVVGKNCGDNILRHITSEGEEICKQGCPLAKTLEDGLPREAEVLLHHKSGFRVPVSVRISPLFDENGEINGAVEVFNDTSACLGIQDELNNLKQLVRVDPLTGLGNRRSVTSEFNRRMGELRRFSTPFGLLFADIDHFKRVNDTYGHDSGDRVLVAVAKTLVSALRNIDTVCRWGGEEFLAVVPNVDEATFRAVAERMRRFVEVSPIPVKSLALPVTISVGGVLARPDDTLESLAARADAMMYKAKQAGRNCTALDCRQPEASETQAPNEC